VKTNENNQEEIFKDLDSDKKLRYGIMAKRIIDLARCFFLIEQGHAVEYLKYCDSSITPENFAIIVNNN